MDSGLLLVDVEDDIRTGDGSDEDTLLQNGKAADVELHHDPENLYDLRIGSGEEGAVDHEVLDLHLRDLLVNYFVAPAVLTGKAECHHNTEYHDSTRENDDGQNILRIRYRKKSGSKCDPAGLQIDLICQFFQCVFLCRYGLVDLNQKGCQPRLVM